MTVFDVFVNGRRKCRAGVGRDGVLTAICNWVKLTGPAARSARRYRQPVEEARLHVGGLSDGSHKSWIDQDLRQGDRVEIVLGRASSSDRPRVKESKSGPPPEQKTAFLNVDLDIWSRSPLDELVKALGRRVVTLHVGRDGRRHVAHLEMNDTRPDPDRVIAGFTALIHSLGRRDRRTWDSADRREFNLGIQVGADNFELRIAPETVRAAAGVNASIGVTVYSVGAPGLKTRGTI